MTLADKWKESFSPPHVYMLMGVECMVILMAGLVWASHHHPVPASLVPVSGHVSQVELPIRSNVPGQEPRHRSASRTDFFTFKVAGSNREYVYDWDDVLGVYLRMSKGAHVELLYGAPRTVWGLKVDGQTVYTPDDLRQWNWEQTKGAIYWFCIALAAFALTLVQWLALPREPD